MFWKKHDDHPACAFSAVLEEELQQIAHSRANRGIERPVTKADPNLEAAEPDATPQGVATSATPEQAARMSEGSEAKAPPHDTGGGGGGGGGGSGESPTEEELLAAAIKKAHERKLVGLAFSGGGIRSGTFNLGILQALARLNLLNRFDYLSTVSGGGYIGGWLAAWMKRCGNLEAVRKALSTERRDEKAHSEPHEIRFLRCFSNYLAPRTGLAGADTWTALAIYLRNLCLNLIILVGALFALLTVPWLLFIGYTAVGRLVNDAAVFSLLDPRVFLSAVLLLIAITVVVTNLFSLLNKRAGKKGESRKFDDARGVHLYVVLPLIVSAFALSSWVPAANTSGERAWWLWGIIGTASYTILWIVCSLIGVAWRKKNTRVNVPKLMTQKDFGWKVVLAATASGFVGGLGVPVIAQWLNNPSVPIERGVFVLGLPLVTAVFLVVGILHQGLAGSAFTTDAREWWSRLGAVMTLWVVFLTGLFALALFGPDLFTLLRIKSPGWVEALIASGWVGTTIGGLVAGKSATGGTKDSGRMLELVAKVAPCVFLLGLGLALSLLVERSLTLSDAYGFGAHPGSAALRLSVTAVALFSIVLVVSWRVGINDFSMHALYRNRLVRAYLGASRTRSPHPFTGFDPNDDDTTLSELRPDCGYAGPYPIINAALNLVAGEELAWQKRKATSFIFTPRYTGYDRSLHRTEKNTAEDNVSTHETKQTHATEDPKEAILSKHAYRVTRKRRNDVGLGTAMAISGAAASPNMGYHTSFPLAFLMTIFNVRLGWWMGNPRHRDCWRRPGPHLGLFYLLYELLGLTNDKRGYVYLSDGGHFENLGLYELVKRRCLHIVVCDASQDAEMRFTGLGNAIEKCRTDFGIEIELDVKAIADMDEAGHSERHFAIGRIHYDRVDKTGQIGTLVYIKSSLTGDEPADLRRYHAMQKRFPHQSTADQFFDETQFESYRKLGEYIVDTLFSPTVDPHKEQTIEQIFLDVRQRWYQRSVASDAAFTKHAQAFNRIMQTIRSSKNLEFLDAQLYPEWQRLVKGIKAPAPELWLPKEYDDIREGFYVCNEMLQLMENVYLDLNLEEGYEHPDNRGWMNLFKHWTWSNMFRVTWAVCGCTSGARFQKFCERHFSMSPGTIKADRFKRDRGESEFTLDLVDEAERRKELNLYEKHLAEKIHPHVQGARSSLYTLKVLVENPLTRKESIDLTFGFAVVEDHKLAYYRVQDHLRKMGFGRLGLVPLIEAAQITGLKHLKTEDPELWDSDDRDEFKQLFDSVMSEIRERVGGVGEAVVK